MSPLCLSACVLQQARAPGSGLHYCPSDFIHCDAETVWELGTLAAARLETRGRNIVPL